MEAILRLARGVAHDFNNYLTAILGYSELLLETMPDDAPPHHFIEAIHKSAQNAAAFSRELLAASRRQVLQLEVVSLNAVVRDMEKTLREMIGGNIDFNVLLDNLDGKVKVDVPQTGQAIINLVLHARDSLSTGGKITIETRNVDLSEVSVSTYAEMNPGPYVLLSVIDNGSGMNETERAQIFEPFFLPKLRRSGSGLSLAAAHGIIRQSGGDILVQSEAGKGTTFQVCLPRIVEKPA